MTPHPALPFGAAVACALICTWIVISVQEITASRPHMSVTGTLAEATTAGSRESPVLRLRLNDEPMEFRLDPALFKDVLHKQVPADLRQRARVSVLVLPEEYAHPLEPPLGGSARIVWMRGLTIGDEEIFGLAQARAWEVENRRWCYLLLAISLAAVAYYGVKWRRSR